MMVNPVDAIDWTWDSSMMDMDWFNSSVTILLTP